jgi:short-subunit dehydrogenase involved in D-alanine esterification of teichoic acids
MATKMVTKSDDIESKEEARELISIIEDTSPSINIVVH